MSPERTDYFLESEEEISRLSNQHDVIKDEMGGLILAPIDLSQPLRVLDSATADGTWVRDFAASTAPVEHQVIGTDIDPANFPANPPQGQSYQVQDINKPWPKEWEGSFDLVHQRLALAAGGSGGEQALQYLAALVKPGGWIQLIEATNDLPDDTGPAFQNFIHVMQGIFTFLGASKNVGNELSGWLNAAGFNDIEDRVCYVKFGPKNPNPNLGKQGVYSTVVAARGLSAFGKTLPEGTIPLSPDQIVNMPDELKNELIDRGAVYPLRVVWARKPTA